MTSKRIRLIVVFVCFCLCGLSRAKENQTPTLKGRVIDYTARPVEGAEVVVYEEVSRNSEEIARMMTSIVKTDKQGRFEIYEEIDSRRYTHIVTRKPGLATAWDRVNRYGMSKGNARVVLVLDRPGVLSGIIVDSNGQPVSGANVQAVPKTSYLSRLSQDLILGPKQWFTTQTDSEGNFRFNVFSPDVSSDFLIKIPTGNCMYTFTTHPQNSIGFEVGRPNIRLVLPRERRIQGRVVEKKTGRPVEGVELLIRPQWDRKDNLCRYCAFTVTSEDNGIFTCAGLPEGWHRIQLTIQEQQKERWAVKPTIIDIRADGPKDDVQVTIEECGTIELSIHEEETNRPLSGFLARAWSQNNFYLLGVDPSGITRLCVLPDEYEVNFWHKRPYSSWRADGPVVVQAGKTSRLPIVMEKVPIVSGRIMTPGGEPAAGILVSVNPCGNQVYTDNNGVFQAEGGKDGCDVIAQDFENGQMCVLHIKEGEVSKRADIRLKPGWTVKGEIIDSNGVGIPAARVCLHGQKVSPEVLTNPRGCFEIRALPPIQPSFDYRISVYTSGFAPKNRRRISLNSDLGKTVETKPIQLEPANTSISGIVVDANGLPAAQVPIFLHEADGSDQPDKSTATNEDGRFEIHRICKGPVRLQANFDSNPGGAGFLYAQGGDQDVKIILGQKGAHQAYVSLAGKPLPDFKDVGIKLSSANIEGKRILVCFWDMNQRPSRHCMSQIVKQTAQLKQKGIIVIAVQASRIDEGMLNQWMKKNNAPFPIGMVQGDIEKTRFSWGIKSLPWLILTDSRHLVVDSGFGLSELDKKIDAAR